MEKKYSGQLRLRMPASLHRELARQASLEGVSLNTYLLCLISQGYGARAVSQAELLPEPVTADTLLIGESEQTYRSDSSLLIIDQPQVRQ